MRPQEPGWRRLDLAARTRVVEDGRVLEDVASLVVHDGAQLQGLSNFERDLGRRHFDRGGSLSLGRGLLSRRGDREPSVGGVDKPGTERGRQGFHPFDPERVERESSADDIND